MVNDDVSPRAHPDGVMSGRCLALARAQRGWRTFSIANLIERPISGTDEPRGKRIDLLFIGIVQLCRGIIDERIKTRHGRDIIRPGVFAENRNATATPSRERVFARSTIAGRNPDVAMHGNNPRRGDSLLSSRPLFIKGKRDVDLLFPHGMCVIESATSNGGQIIGETVRYTRERKPEARAEKRGREREKRRK